MIERRSRKMARVGRSTMHPALLAGLAILLAASATPAHEYRVGQLEIVHPWAFATPLSATTGAVYMSIVNEGRVADRLVRVESPAAARVELHEVSIENDVMWMRPVDALEIPPGDTVLLEPGGLHVMLIGLRKRLVEGFGVSLTLVFEHAGPVRVDATIEPPGAPPAESLKATRP